MLLKEIGGPGQKKLGAASVSIIGAGGLGAPAALYLAAAGVGRLVIIDPDVVDLSNLQRQVLYRSDDVGVAKPLAAAAHLKALDPSVHVETVTARLTSDNAARLIAGTDVVLDGTDSFETRFAVNAACHALGLPLVSGAVGRWDGQVAVFASGRSRGKPADQRLPCYRCWVPEAPPEAEGCAAQGVVGALTGVIGSMMALEAVKLLTGAGQPLTGRILLYDGLSAQARTVRLAADLACKCCGEP